MPQSQPSLVGPSQQLSHALTLVLRAQRRMSRLTPQQQARALRQLAQVEGAAHAAIWCACRAPGQRVPG